MKAAAVARPSGRGLPDGATRQLKGLKLHVGCGPRHLPGFVHIDLADFPHIDYRRDVRDLSFLPAGCADGLYASHVLEYFDRFEVRAVLQSWRTVLQPGGWLRVAVPDFAVLTSVYKHTGRLDLILGPLYGRMAIGGTDRIIYHKTTYDFDSLKRTLEASGFSNVRRYDWRLTVHKDYDDHSQAYLPHMDKERGTLVSLNVEATK